MSSKFNPLNKQVLIGNIGELIAKHYIESIKKEEVVSSNNDYKYDLLTSSSIKYEVKNDLKYIIYKKNLFLEFQSNDKPSGIKTTDSNYYVFVCPNDDSYNVVDIVEFKTDDLKILTNEKNENDLMKKSTSYLDYNNNITPYKTKGFILPIKIYEPYAVITTFKRTTNSKLYDTIDEIIKLI